MHAEQSVPAQEFLKGDAYAGPIMKAEIGGAYALIYGELP
jgi:hypothetical protein